MKLRMMIHLLCSQIPVVEVRDHVASIGRLGHALVDFLLANHALGCHLLRWHLWTAVASSWLHRIFEHNCLVVGVIGILALIQRVILDQLSIVLQLGISNADVSFQGRSIID